jgi:hypothetical protein
MTPRAGRSVFSRPLGVLAETMPSDANGGVSCVGVGDVAQLGGLGDGLGTRLEIAGRGVDGDDLVIVAMDDPGHVSGISA